MFEANYHTHTYRCKHATGDAADYCQAAIHQGLKTLGFSDHAPLPDARWQSVRMEPGELVDYCEAIDEAQRRYPHLRVYKGLEVEYLPEWTNYVQDVFFGEFGMDYLVGGAHWYPHEGEWLSLYGAPMTASMLRSYTDYLIEGMRSGLYAFIAHPDLFGNAYLVWDDIAWDCAKAMLSAAADLNLPMEINAYGLRKPLLDTPEGRRHKYPWLPFWELAAACKTPVIVNSDAHRPEDVTAKVDEALDIARRCGVTLVDDIFASAPMLT